VHAPLTHVEVKELLQGSKVGFQPREANGVLARAAANEIAEFRTRLTGGPLVDGTVEFNRLHGTYRVTIVR